jgi:hypothetical protein
LHYIIKQPSLYVFDSGLLFKWRFVCYVLYLCFFLLVFVYGFTCLWVYMSLVLHVSGLLCLMSISSSVYVFFVYVYVCFISISSSVYGFLWHHDIQHNDNQHDDTQQNDIEHNDGLFVTLCITLCIFFMRIVVMLSVMFLSLCWVPCFCCYDECHVFVVMLSGMFLLLWWVMQGLIKLSVVNLIVVVLSVWHCVYVLGLICLWPSLPCLQMTAMQLLNCKQWREGWSRKRSRKHFSKWQTSHSWDRQRPGKKFRFSREFIEKFGNATIFW